MPTDLELIAHQAETLFLHNEAKRLLYVNEPDKPEAPRFFLGRTTQGNICRFRHNLPKTVVKRLGELAALEPIPRALQGEPAYLEAFQSVLHEHGAVQAVWMGPAYRFSGGLEWPSGVVRITDANADLLEEGFTDLKAVLSAKQPCVAVVSEHRAVSICCCARSSTYAAEASLETLGAFRARGYAAAVVTGWAAAVRDEGRVPLYSTSWDNLASQGVARKLGLTMYGADLHIT